MQGGAVVDPGGGKKGGKGKSKVNSTGKASIRKESRTYSNLIFSMEQFEKHLIQLDKKAKVNCPILTTVRVEVFLISRFSWVADDTKIITRGRWNYYPK